jgi:hypothetical protein
MLNDKSTSAPTGLAGYHYQVDVSIYLSLDLLQTTCNVPPSHISECIKDRRTV